MMKHAIISTISLVVSLGFITPAFAYYFRLDADRSSHREEVRAIKATADIRRPAERPTRRSIQSAVDRRSVRVDQRTMTRESSIKTTTKDTHLERTRRDYNLRLENRRPKLGSDRYRVLRPNTRSLRLQMDEQGALPPRIVQTGFYTYDKPTRRDIRENGYFSGIVDRNRNILREMQENSR